MKNYAIISLIIPMKSQVKANFKTQFILTKWLEMKWLSSSDTCLQNAGQATSLDSFTHLATVDKSANQLSS